MDFKEFLSSCTSRSSTFQLSSLKSKNIKLYNHIYGSKHIGRKHLLTINVVEHLRKLRERGVDSKMIVPETYIIKGDTHEMDLESCISSIASHPENSMWIIKPGEFSNRGKGI